jgi:bifunctional UDP-N-acetylglucosamine pyrophosphorylase/glucosamine-1-phosphate N-acetyltransferase
VSSANASVMGKSISAVILAAGEGKRMHSHIPKVLFRILGKEILNFVVDLVRAIRFREIVIVVGKEHRAIKDAVGRGVAYAVQDPPLGSGDAARQGLLMTHAKDCLILCGDVPLLSRETVIELLEYHKKQAADLTLLTCRVRNPFGYGRILRDRRGRILGIIEQTDATIKQQKINEINAGVYCGRRGLVLQILNKITAQNRQGEYYLTDIVTEMVRSKRKVGALMIDNEEEITGINSKIDLARAREIIKKRWFDELMKRGVYIEDPATTSIDLTVRIGNEVHIRPNTIIEGKTVVKAGSIIGPFVYIKDGKRINK